MSACYLGRGPRTFVAPANHVDSVPAKAWKGKLEASWKAADGENPLMLLTGPTMLVRVRRHVHLDVSHMAMTESPPPVASHRPVGDISAVMQLEVWPFKANSEESSSVSE